MQRDGAGFTLPHLISWIFLSSPCWDGDDFFWFEEQDIDGPCDISVRCVHCRGASCRAVIDQCLCYLATFLCIREDSRLDEEISRKTYRFLLEHIRFGSTVSCQSNTVENRRSASRSSNFSIGRWNTTAIERCCSWIVVVARRIVALVVSIDVSIDRVEWSCKTRLDPLRFVRILFNS